MKKAEIRGGKRNGSPKNRVRIEFWDAREFGGAVETVNLPGDWLLAFKRGEFAKCAMSPALHLNKPRCAKGQTGDCDRTIVRRMESGNRARWQELCEQVAREQDPAKVLALSEEINRLLQENEDRRASHKLPSAA